MRKGYWFWKIMFLLGRIDKDRWENIQKLEKGYGPDHEDIQGICPYPKSQVYGDSCDERHHCWSVERDWDEAKHDEIQRCLLCLLRQSMK